MQNKNHLTEDDVKKLQAVFGELNCITGLSRLGLTYSCEEMARRIHELSKEVFRSVKRIHSYLNGTSNLAVRFTYAKSENWKLKLYTDSSLADVTTERYKSTGGYLLQLEENIIYRLEVKKDEVCLYKYCRS